MTQDTDNAPPDDAALQYLGVREARTVDAIVERLIPTDELGPGARDAGVTTYIDRALAGFSRDLQLVYRLGLRELDEACRAEHDAVFADLDGAAQDAIVTRWLGTAVPETDDATREDLWSPARLPGSEKAQAAADAETEAAHPDGAETHERGRERSARLLRLFAVIREHAVEGFFCDPGYGGNRDAVGWRLVNFPGAQWGYTAEQMRPGYDASQIPITTLGQLRRQLPDVPADTYQGE